MTATESKEIETPAWSQGPGASLRAAREARQIDMEKIAVQLHLSRAKVEAIERDDYEVLPGSVFVRGYLKNYARLVGLSVSHILQAYESRRPEETISTPVVKKSIRSEVSSGHTGVRLVTWAIVLVLAALVAVWWWGYIDSWHRIGAKPGLEPTSTTEVPPFAVPSERFGAEPPAAAPGTPADNADSFTPPPEDAVAAPDAPSTEESGSGSASPEPEAAPGARTQPATVPAESAGAPTQGSGVVLEFSASCWVDVRDSSGRFKISGEVRKGEKRTLEGVPPWSLVLGNARAVSITVDGRPFDLGRYVTGNVARLKLQPDAR